jgi:hypothetical protein
VKPVFKDLRKQSRLIILQIIVTGEIIMFKIYNLLFIICAVLCLMATQAAAQVDKDAQPATTSTLNRVQLPAGALRVNDQSVPADITNTLGKLIELGQGKLRQGESEVLIWSGGNYRKSNSLHLVRKLTENMQIGGWTYAVGEQNREFTVFNSINTGERRAVIGFWTAKDDFLMLAWTEMLPVNSSRGESPKINNISNESNAARSNSADNGSARVVNAEKNALWVNVMGNEMPQMPQFPMLSPKPNRVCGYVKDWTGKPLAGATIGIRASYFAGHYSGAQGTTNANGYYEFVVPKGSAHFYNAGYQIEWGDGIAAVSLHPADGKLDSFTTVDGAVENFVMLPYGITSRENVQQNPRLASAYYGGSIYVHYYAAEAGNNGSMDGSLIEGSILEITLTPENAAAEKPFVIRQPVGFAGNVTINNIPLLGRYKISARVGGKMLKLKENRNYNQLFGLSPSETVGEASVLFVPGEAKASMVGPAHGTWDSVSLSVLMP